MDLLPMPRQIGLKRAFCTSSDDFVRYVRDLNGKACLYTSLYSFDVPGDYDSVVMDRAWWDFDMNDEWPMEQVKLHVATLLQRLDGDVRLVATGRGFHVHQPFARPVRGRDWAGHLDRYEREMAKGLGSLDGVGYPEKMTRISGTRNVKRGRWAVTIRARDFQRNPRMRIPDRPVEAYRHLDPFQGVVHRDQCFDLVKWVHANPAPQRPATGLSTDGKALGLTHGPCALPPCLERAIHVSNPPHHVRVALVQEMRRQLAFYAPPSAMTQQENTEITDEICAFIEGLGWLDYNEGVTRRYVDGVVRKYTHAPSPLWYQKHNLCRGDDCWFCARCSR